MAKELDPLLEINKFELYSLYYVNSRTKRLDKVKTQVIPSAVDEIISLPVFYKYSFDIK